MKKKALSVINWKPDAKSKTIRTLILKTNEKRGCFWQSVTGHVEKGESFQEAALREAQEETSLDFLHPAQYLGLEHHFEGRFGPCHEKAFYLCLYGKEAPTPKLDPSEHIEYLWADPSEAIEKIEHPFNKKAIERSTGAASPLFLNSQGIFFQDGEEITHQRTVELLHRSLKSNEKKQTYVVIGNEFLDVIVEDCLYFIQNIDSKKGEAKLLYGEWQEIESIHIQDGQGAYATLPNGKKAKFLRSTYYDLVKDLEEKDGKYFIQWKGHQLNVG